MATERPSEEPGPLPGPMMKAIARAATEVEIAEGELAVVYGSHDRGVFAQLLAERLSPASVVVAALDTRQAAAASERAGAARVVVVERLADAVDDAPVRVVAMVPGGYEGKARLRAMIADAAERLADGGSLLIVSHARRGAGTLMRLAEEAFGNAEVVARGWGGMRVLRAVRSGDAASVPAADAAPVEAELRGRRFSFATGAGVFSRERLDPGTRLLIESVEPAGARTVLDLGCGYGPIGIAVAAAAPDARVTMIDVDARAVELARANAERNDLAAATETLVADGPAPLSRRFDLILSHFPLHAPRGDRDRLVAATHDALEPGGRFCAVTLREYDLTPVAEPLFASVERIAEDERYVVICARRAG